VANELIVTDNRGLTMRDADAEVEEASTAVVVADVPPVVAGSFTDERDGQTYRTVKMPDGKVWMAENLNYKTPEGSWCYDDNPDMGAQYGRLYTWEAAKAAAPDGWHLPTREEWSNLVKASGGDVAGKKLKSASGWNKKGNGTDEYGFSALPGGTRISVGSFYDAGYYGVWWSATEGDGSLAYGRGMHYDYGNVNERYYDKTLGFSVRCVGDVVEEPNGN